MIRILPWLYLLVRAESAVRGATEEASEYLRNSMVTKDGLIIKSNMLLEEYLPAFPERSFIVSRISVESFSETTPDDFHAYSVFVFKLDHELKECGTQGDVLRSTAKLNVLNLFNKMLSRFASLRYLVDQREEGHALRDILVDFWSKSTNDEVDMEPLESQMRTLMEIATGFERNQWGEDEKLNLIPHMAYSLVELSTLIRFFPDIADPESVDTILSHLHSVVHSQQDSLKRARRCFEDLYRRFDHLSGAVPSWVHSLIFRPVESLWIRSLEQLDRQERVRVATQKLLKQVRADLLTRNIANDSKRDQFFEILDHFVEECDQKTVRQMNQVIQLVMEVRHLDVRQVFSIQALAGGPRAGDDDMSEALQLAEKLGSSSSQAASIHWKLIQAEDIETKKEIIENKNSVLSRFSQWDPSAESRDRLYYQFDNAVALQVNNDLFDIFEKHHLLRDLSDAYHDDGLYLMDELRGLQDHVETAVLLVDGIQALAHFPYRFREEHFQWETLVAAKAAYFYTYFQTLESIGLFVVRSLTYALPTLFSPEKSVFDRVFSEDLEHLIPEDSFRLIRKALELQVFYRDLFPDLQADSSFMFLEIACRNINESEEDYLSKLVERVTPIVQELEALLHAKFRQVIPGLVHRLNSAFETRVLHRRPPRGERNLIKKIASVREIAGPLVVIGLQKLILKYIWNGQRMRGTHDWVFQAIVLSLVRFLKKKKPHESIIPLADYIKELNEDFESLRWQDDANSAVFSEKDIIDRAFELQRKFGVSMLKLFPQVLPEWTFRKIFFARKIIEVFVLLEGPSEWEEHDLTSLIVEADEEKLRISFPVVSALFDLRVESIENTPLISSGRWLKEFLGGRKGKLIKWVQEMSVARNLSIPQRLESLMNRIDAIFGKRSSQLAIAYRELPRQLLRWELEAGFLHEPSRGVTEIEEMASTLVDIPESVAHLLSHNLFVKYETPLKDSIKQLLGLAFRITTMTASDRQSFIARIRMLSVKIRSESVDAPTTVSSHFAVIRDLPARLSRLLVSPGDPCWEAFSALQEAVSILSELQDTFGTEPSAELERYAGDILALTDRISCLSTSKACEDAEAHLSTLLQETQEVLGGLAALRRTIRTRYI